MWHDLQSPDLLSGPHDLRDLPDLSGLDTSNRARAHHPAGSRLTRPRRPDLTLLDAHRSARTEPDRRASPAA